MHMVKAPSKLQIHFYFYTSIYILEVHFQRNGFTFHRSVHRGSCSQSPCNFFSLTTMYSFIASVHLTAQFLCHLNDSHLIKRCQVAGVFFCPWSLNFNMIQVEIGILVFAWIFLNFSLTFYCGCCCCCFCC